MPKYLLSTTIFLIVLTGKGIAAEDESYPKFNIGVTGIQATIPVSCDKAIVVEVGTDTPAHGMIEKGDVIMAVNGAKLQGAIGDFVLGIDPRRMLGEAIGKAEATDGILTFTVDRDGTVIDRSITLPVLGAYSESWPRNCEKSGTIIAETVAYLKRVQREDGSFAFPLPENNSGDIIGNCFASLFLLSTDDPDGIAMAGKYAAYLGKGYEKEGVPESHWAKGPMGILLAEYYLKTGDKTVLPTLSALCEAVADTQVVGGWGHGGKPGPVYSHGGIMTLPSASILSALTLARECGVTEGEDAFKRSFAYYSRFPGHDGCSYGDQRGDSGGSDNGKAAALAIAFSLVDSDASKRLSEFLALQSIEGYYGTQDGHGGCSFNVLWRGIGTVHVNPEYDLFYRRQMDDLTWLYDLSRLPGGGFNMLPPRARGYGSPNLSGVYWGIGMAMAYTAPRQSLRITGGKPTVYSKTMPPPAPGCEGIETSEFLRTDYCRGGEVNTMNPAEISKDLSYFLGGPKGKPTVQQCATLMRHYLPHVRNWAANNLNILGTPAAFDEIEKALQHSDARVRRAGFNAIVNYLGSWFTVDRRRNNVPSKVVIERYMPYIKKTLDNPNSDWWEMDGAIFALSRSGADNVRSYLPLLKKYARHEEMWLRQSAFYCISHGLNEQIDGQTMVFLAECYAREGRPFLRNLMQGWIRELTKENKAGAPPPFDDETQVQLAEILSRPITDTRWAYGYVENGGISPRDPFHVLNTVKNFPPSYQVHFCQAWMDTIDAWEHKDFYDNNEITFCETLTQICLEIGNDARPLMERIAQVYAEKNKMRRGMKKVGAGIKTYEESFGPLKNSIDKPVVAKTVDTRPLRKGLIGYWQFDEGKGASSKDGSANNYSAVLKGGVSWDQGLIGKAVTIGKGQIVEIPGYKDPLTDGRIMNLSVSFWIKTKDYGSGRIGKGRHEVFRKIVTNWFYSFDARGAGWDVRLPDNCLYPFVTAAFDNGQHGLTPMANKETGIPDYMFKAVDDGNNWHHVVFAYDGKRKSFAGWVDGNRSDTTSGWNSDSTKDLNAASHIIPALADILTIGGAFEKDGQVESFDEVAIWDRVLTDEEVNMLYNNGFGSAIDM